MLALVLALPFAAGCGSDDEGDVRDTLAAFAEATAKKDYQRICDDLLAPALLENLRRTNLPCEVALKTGLEDRRRPQLRVLSVRVDDDTASARVRSTAEGEEPSEDIVQLVKVDGDWRIASLSSEGAPSA